MATKERDDFSIKVIESLKLRAAFICSNPECKKMTIAPSEISETNVQYIGKCAHITAARKGGPRYNEHLSSEQRSGIRNGIFLCSNCADLIDKNNGIDYKVDILEKWKKSHEEWILKNLNKTIENNSSSINISSNNQLGGIVANVVNISNSTSEKAKTINDHDKNLFINGEEILNEDFLILITDKLISEESTNISQLDKLEDFLDFYEKTSNDYINDNIENYKEKLIEALDNLTDFIHCNFDKYPYNQTETDFRICMNPKVNTDRAGDLTTENFNEHQRLKHLLDEKIDDLLEAYAIFRKVIKKILYI